MSKMKEKENLYMDTVEYFRIVEPNANKIDVHDNSSLRQMQDKIYANKNNKRTSYKKNN
jgi:hypothetical protein